MVVVTIVVINIMSLVDVWVSDFGRTIVCTVIHTSDIMIPLHV